MVTRLRGSGFRSRRTEWSAFEFDRFRAFGFDDRTAGTGRDDDFDGNLDPTALIVDAGKRANGLEDVAGRGSEVFDFLDDVGGGHADILHAARVNAGGVSVTVDNSGVPDIVVTSDGGGGMPVEKVLLDQFAVGVAADGAFAGVTIESRFVYGWHSGFGAPFWTRRVFDMGDEAYFGGSGVSRRLVGMGGGGLRVGRRGSDKRDIDGDFHAALAGDVLQSLNDDLIGFGAVAFDLALAFTGSEALILFVGDGVFFGIRILRSAEVGVFGAAALLKAFHFSCFTSSEA